MIRLDELQQAYLCLRRRKRFLDRKLDAWSSTDNENARQHVVDEAEALVTALAVLQHEMKEELQDELEELDDE